MLYTIIGAITGGLIAYCLAKLNGASFDDRAGIVRVMPAGEMIVILGVVCGGSLGFGVGSTKLLAGTYLEL